MNKSGYVVLVVIEGPPTPNRFTGREDRRKPDTIEDQLWSEGPMPMERLEALLQARLKDEQ